MSTNTTKNRLIEKINTLSEVELNAVLSFVEKLEQSGKDNGEFQTQKTDEERKALAERFERLCDKTQALLADNSITEEEIQAEIEAYRRGE
ncbi:hypothetical protein [Dactylococcopsis salina]|uniref:Uncharacterized protein n=1 Tax=Dactylococcopsis salina (strain PCC 8305) TaxID=13035 RepID=K9YPP8_DACS8|nr:hypothetical protein [Dactylococcopsis salina]AFZ48849.1 hypothetical protein Dacsa_0025 [Dactylococcopsis salina PCC 8305]